MTSGTVYLLREMDYCKECCKEMKEEDLKISDEWAETCPKCGRRSNVVALSKECPFCNPPEITVTSNKFKE